MKQLDNAFNITPEVVEDEKVGITPEQKPDRLTKDEITRDYEYTRNRVMEGKKISESQTEFLANCPKHNSKFCWWCHIKVKCENKRKGKNYGKSN